METKEMYLAGVLLAQRWVDEAIIRGDSEDAIKSFRRILDRAIEKYYTQSD